MITQNNEYKNPTNKTIVSIWKIFFFTASIMYLSQRTVIFKGQFFLIYFSLFITCLVTIVIIFRKKLGMERLGYVFLTCLSLVLLSPGILDIPAYLKNEPQIVEGIPTKIELSSYKGLGWYNVEIKGVTFEFPFNKMSSKLKNNWFIVKYLPHSKYIMDYNILPEK